ncbi:hypothetical protein Ciccas_011697 [Cichlidogyrus casuarinus]|uniref:Antistasin-like domain-containing protein n=1 Tax=Cichlidogyrus casuarinus TaxID=1844966 RepID=A0ABD2PRV1_9PLAT
MYLICIALPITLIFYAAGSRAEDSEDTQSLEDHWVLNRREQRPIHVANLWHGPPRVHHFGRFERPDIHEEIEPFWMMDEHNPRHFPPRPLQPMPMEAPIHQLLDQSQISPISNMQKGMYPIQVFGPSMPPHNPRNVILNREQQKTIDLQSVDLGGKISKVEANAPESDKDAIIAGTVHSSSKNAEDEQVPKEEPVDIEVKPVVNVDNSESSGCPQITCPRQCPGGLSKLDLNNGCPTCDCCPAVTCRMACDKGYESDQHGCPICRCVN